jgi:hypothetical protein
MTPNPQGLRAIIAIFDREFKGNRLDKEDEKLWPKGIVYQSGETNNLFLAFNRGVAFGMAAVRSTLSSQPWGSENG